MTKLELGIKLATEWHVSQVDKAGQPYILHALSVMFRVRRDGRDEETQIAAVLHDVVEDTPRDLNNIYRYFGRQMVDIIDALTRRKGEPYEQFIERCAAHPVACVVKLADIEDNLDPARHAWISPEKLPDFRRLRERYEKARAFLLAAS